MTYYTEKFARCSTRLWNWRKNIPFSIFEKNAIKKNLKKSGTLSIQNIIVNAKLEGAIEEN